MTALPLSRLARVDKGIDQWEPRARSGADPHAYPGRPVEYAQEVLGIDTLTPEQGDMLRLLHVPPCRVLCPSAHDVGKTFAAGVAVNYWFDSYEPGVAISTAPTQRDVVDLLWTEIRLQRQRAGLSMPFSGPRAPEMRTGEDHYAKGYTATKGESFQGRHRPRMLFVFDEANGVGPMYWTTTKTMFDPTLGHAQLAIFNPTDTTSAAYQEDMACDEADGSPRWHRIRLSALTHPNVLADLEGRPRPVPGAVNLAMVNEWVRDWCEPVDAADRTATDIEWPPASGNWYRPGPIFQARAMGIWPDLGDGVWSPALWEACLQGGRPFPPHELPQLGCDCATGKGDDYMAIHGRWGVDSVHHETSNTMDPHRIFVRLREACALLADLANRHRDRAAAPVQPRQLSIKIDDDATGNAVRAFLVAAGYLVIAVGAGTTPQDPEKYPNRRSELWFRGAAKAKAGLVGLSRLDRATRARLRQQLLAPTWSLDAAGRRVVEPKEKTKDKIGRSPDDADAFNLAHYDAPAAAYEAHAKAEPARREEEPERETPTRSRGGHAGHRMR